MVETSRDPLLKASTTSPPSDDTSHNLFQPLRADIKCPVGKKNPSTSKSVTGSSGGMKSSTQKMDLSSSPGMKGKVISLHDGFHLDVIQGGSIPPKAVVEFESGMTLMVDQRMKWERINNPS